jgi:hypothetical protein
MTDLILDLDFKFSYFFKVFDGLISVLECLY